MSNLKSELEKGCGKTTLNLNGEVVEICKILKDGEVYIEQAQPLTIEGIVKVCNAPEIDYKLCPTCQAKLQQEKTK